MKMQLTDFYLYWLNNSATIPQLASHAGITEEQVKELLEKYHGAGYDPSLKILASIHKFDPPHFVAFCRKEPIVTNFKINHDQVPLWYVEGLIKTYKEHGYYNMLAYVKELGLTPVKARITSIGYEVDVDPGDKPSIEHFTSVNGKTVRLSYVDIANESIVKNFKF